MGDNNIDQNEIEQNRADNIKNNGILQEEIRIGILKEKRRRKIIKFAAIILFPILLSILWVLDIGSYLKIKQHITSYDAIIDAKSILSLAEGWSIYLSLSEFAKKFINLEENYGLVCVVLSGEYNSGKTYILNELEEANFNSSYGYSTPSFAFYHSRLRPNYVYLDSMGWNRLSSSSQETDEHSNKIRNVKATDDYISSAHSLGSIIIDVVGTGKNSDICKIQHRHNLYLEAKDKKAVVVVHNFKDIERIEDVKKYIRDDITNSEIGGKQESSNIPGCEFWSINGASHFVMAKKGSAAGDKYNKCAIDLIKETVLYSRHDIKKINLLGELIKLTSKKVSSYFKDPNIKKDSFVKTIVDETDLSLFSKSVGWIFNTFSTKDTKETLKTTQTNFIVEPHNWEVIVDDNKIRLKNNTFQLEFIYSDCCGFQQSGYDPKTDIIQDKNSFLIAIDAPNSDVFWFCTTAEYKEKIYAVIDRILPTYPKGNVKKSIDSRTFGSIIKEFDLPKAQWADCQTMVKSSVYKDGVSFVKIHDSSITDVGSPFNS